MIEREIQASDPVYTSANVSEERIPKLKHLLFFYQTRVRSLVMLVSDYLPNSLTHSCLVNLIGLVCEGSA